MMTSAPSTSTFSKLTEGRCCCPMLADSPTPPQSRNSTFKAGLHNALVCSDCSSIFVLIWLKHWNPPSPLAPLSAVTRPNMLCLLYNENEQKCCHHWQFNGHFHIRHNAVSRAKASNSKLNTFPNTLAPPMVSTY